MQRNGGKFFYAQFHDLSFDVLNREYKYLRVFAIYAVLSRFCTAPPITLRRQPVLRTGAIMVWMLNAHIYRPGDQRWDLPLVACCALQRPQGNNDWEETGIADNEELEPAFEVRGAYFVADLVWDNDLFRLPALGERELDMAQFRAVFNIGFHQLQSAMMSQAITGRTRTLAKNMVKHPRIPRPRNLVMREPLPDNPPVEDFGLGEAGVTIAANTGMNGTDIEGGLAIPHLDPDAQVGLIWQELFHNIMAVSPNERNGPSYCTLRAEVINTVTEQLFVSTTLPFHAVQLKIVDINTWDKILFDRFFPPKILRTEGRITLQNFRLCTYFAMWETLVADVTPDGLRLIRRQLLERWRNLAWLPYSSVDRMWDTRVAGTGNFKRLPVGTRGAAPKIAINPRLNIVDDFTLQGM
jgi:hypothetical protein